MLIVILFSSDFSPDATTSGIKALMRNLDLWATNSKKTHSIKTEKKKVLKPKKSAISKNQQFSSNVTYTCILVKYFNHELIT